MSNSFRVVVGLLIYSLLGLILSNQEIYARLSYLWLFIIIGNYLLSRFALRSIALKRWARSQKGQVGEIFEETFELENKGRYPRIWLEIEDQSKLPGSKGSRVFTFVGGKRTRTYVSRIKLTMRGAYSLGPSIIRSGDPFGFFPVSIEIPASEELTVYPHIVDVRSFPSPIGLLPGGDSVRRRTHQITPNAATVRDYSNGDPISRIHWQSTARRDRLMVKEFELDPMAEVFLFLDAQKKVHVSKNFNLDSDAGSVMLGTRMDRKLVPSTEEYMASIAASIARYFLAQDRTLALKISGRFPNDLAPDRGARQSSKIMESMALFKADGSETFSAYVLNQARFLPRGSTVVLISPAVNGKTEFMIDALQRLGLRPLMILLDAASFGGESGSQELFQRIEAIKIPVMLIKEGDDLGAVLNSAHDFQFVSKFFRVNVR